MNRSEHDSKRLQNGLYCSCPCCGYPTLSSRGQFEICTLCNWTDDGQDDMDADETSGGPNEDYSLSEARDNFGMYLTMYRPSDEQAFKLETRKLSIKRALIDIYTKMLGAQDSVEIEELRNRAEELESKL